MASRYWVLPHRGQRYSYVGTATPITAVDRLDRGAVGVRVADTMRTDTLEALVARERSDFSPDQRPVAHVVIGRVMQNAVRSTALVSRVYSIQLRTIFQFPGLAKDGRSLSWILRHR